jgi:hypothetical protein
MPDRHIRISGENTAVCGEVDKLLSQLLSSSLLGRDAV